MVTNDVAKQKQQFGRGIRTLFATWCKSKGDEGGHEESSDLDEI